MKIQPRNKRELMAAALGRIECDFAVTNCRYLNLFTGEEYPATVYIHDGFVVHVEPNPKSAPEKAKQVVDAGGRYILPGLIDAHVHIESSLMTPPVFASAVVPHGVTCVITDPHEIGNVLGEEAVVYMHDAGSDLPMYQFIDIPSCVPSVPGLEEAGASFDASVIDRLAKLPHVIGLAEVMDFLGVVDGEDRMMEIIDAAERNGLYLQGHLPAGFGRLVSAYRIGGPLTCHETGRPGEALDKLRAGMYVDARESSMCYNLPTIWNDVKDLPWRDRLSLCTDDREADDILANGQLDLVLRNIIKLGMDPIEAIRAATLHPAQEAGLENLGAVAPGYVANFLLVDDLEQFTVHAVYFEGREVAREGRLLTAIPRRQFAVEQKNSVNAPDLTLEDFRLRAPAGCGDRVRINVLTYGDYTSLTRIESEELPVKDGFVDISGDDELCFAMVVNRYGTGNRTFGLVRGFGLARGADGSTISHDCHNLTLVFRDPESALAVYNQLRSVGGGICAAENGKVVCTLALPVGGLMSADPAEQTAAAATAMKQALRELGLEMTNPLLRIATLALPVVPAAKFTDLGLVDVMKKAFVPIFPEN
ncbi:MAG TPA: amidohydrolase family protein [Candidatus Pygmaiobacter gallistercoris]|nr:amidohydrolase family protein [Candidatus Pygmaiobacter gallistercoris]